ncbi:MAG: hypothetical protein IIB21_06095, partial [Chloroflexi bacterium]|nr:hypothetical protein [Chloroflexota bacterium]
MPIDDRELKAKAAISGLGITEQGRIYGHSAAWFAAEAIGLALEDAGLPKEEIDGLLVNQGVTPLPGMGGIDLQNHLGLTNLRLLASMNVGGATAGGSLLAAMGAILSGDRIHVDRGGILVLSLPDRSVLKITGEADVDLHVDQFSGAMYNLALGSLLSVVPTGNNHIILGPTASVGIKGTVFFRQVFNENTRITRTMEGTLEVPKGIDDYFCTCHGEVGYMPHPKEKRVVHRDRAHHHNSFFLRRDDKGMRFVKAPMLNHFDDEIAELIA